MNLRSQSFGASTEVDGFDVPQVALGMQFHINPRFFA